MKCPIDDSDLVMAERRGIEIDDCPKRRGVWLDRGELEKIIERSAAEVAPGPERAPPSGHYREPSYDHPRHKKRKSLLRRDLRLLRPTQRVAEWRPLGAARTRSTMPTPF